MERVSAYFNKFAHSVGAFGVGQENSVNASCKDLSELPGVGPHDLRTGSFDGGFDNDSWGSVSTFGRATVDHTAHELVKSGHVERSVFHADVDEIGPCAGGFQARLVGQDVAGVAADLIDGLSRFQKLNYFVYAACHCESPQFCEYVRDYELSEWWHVT